MQFTLKKALEKIENLESKNNNLQDENNNLQNKLKATEEKAKHYAEEYDKVIQAFKQSQREKYGKKSERFIAENEEQQPLFASPEIDNNKEPENKKDIESITYTRTKKGSKKADLSAIPVREVTIPVKEAELECSCGNKKEVIRYEEKSKLNYIPAVFEIIIEKREVVACRKGCEKSIQTAEAPLHILPKSKATESLLAYLAVSKVLDRQPLYHLEKKIERRFYWRIPRQTMARWLIQISEKLQPLVNLMKDELIGYDVASCDATTLQVLNEPDRPAERKSYAYCIRGGPPEKKVTIFEYNGYSHKDYLVETFADFKGTIYTDAAPVYEKMAAGADITLCYCNAHARRKFEQIVKLSKNKDGIAKKALLYYRTLYKIESQAKKDELTNDEIYKVRQKQSKPIMAEMKEWLTDLQPKILPKSPLGKSIVYTLNHWSVLTTFLEDGRLEIDNNATEREIRPFVIARKNFLFACTQAGADSLALHFSLILTAKNHGLDPYKYYKYILTEIPKCKSIADYVNILPWNIKI